MSFNTELYNNLATNPGNLFFSGFSIDVALGMTNAGAKGNTEKALNNLLNGPKDYKTIVSEVNKENPGYKLVTANALWAANDYEFFEEFKQIIRDVFGGDFKKVNFEDSDGAVKAINDWVNNQTNGKIPELVAKSLINKQTRLILTNAIYFKGKWDREFDKKNTKKGLFNSKIECSFMNDQAKYKYYEDDALQAVDIPYKGGDLSLLVVLPKNEVEWSDDLYSKITDNFRYQQVVLTLPSFKIEASFLMRDILSKMGAEVIFSDNADFSGIGKELLKVSEVVHKAFVEVNEEGTEAAAATAVHMVVRSMMSGPKVFCADRPFMFFIRNKDTILFSGRLENPK